MTPISACATLLHAGFGDGPALAGTSGDVVYGDGKCLFGNIARWSRCPWPAPRC